MPGDSENPDVVILQIPYELTTSYGQGTAQGPAACIAASGQVELFDPMLGVDLPAGYNIYTAPAWDEEGHTLKDQLAEFQTTFKIGKMVTHFLLFWAASMAYYQQLSSLCAIIQILKAIIQN